MFQTSRSWGLAVLLGALFFAMLIQVPQFLHMADARYRGVLVQLNSDESVYLARVEEALNGRPEQSAEAIVGNPGLRASQPALLEETIGRVFSFTGWRAATVLQVMDSVTMFLLVILLCLFFRFCGFTRILSLAGTVFFCVIELYNLNRPIHQALSLVLLLAALDLLMLGMERRRTLGIPGAILLGLLFGDYFWNWSFGWLWAGILLVQSLVVWILTRRSQNVGRQFLFILIGFVCALPFLREMLQISRDPLYGQVFFRSGIHPSHLPESWIYSGLFAVMAIGMSIGLLGTADERNRYRFAIVTILAAFLALNQQVIHGLVFNFASHYLLVLGVAAIAVVLTAVSVRRPAVIIAACAASVYLAALVYDGRFVSTQFIVHDRFSRQHFATLLPVLDALPRATILSDPDTEMFIAASTHHDVVYSLYLKNVLMSHEDIARRYCLTQVPVGPAERLLEEVQAVYPDADRAFKNDPGVREREVRMLRDACNDADRRPRDMLRNFTVRYILWDERRQPEWNLRRFRIPLTKVADGEGWSLWEI